MLIHPAMSEVSASTTPVPVVTVTEEISAIMADWETALRRRAAARTADAYRRDLTAFFTYLAGQSGRAVHLAELAALRSDMIAAYRDRRLALGQAPASVARALSALRRFFQFLTASGVADNPSIQTVKLPDIPKPSGGSLSPEAIRQALAGVADVSDAPWVAQRDAALFALLYGAGLSLGEALSLNRERTPVGATLNVVGRNGKQRTASVPAFAAAAIDAYLSACPYRLEPGQPLFIGLRGRRLNPGVVQRQMRRLRAALGLPAAATPRAFRRYFAQQAQAAGGDIRAIQRLLGHAHPATTRRYTRED
jgi:integrase/recombinase XerC